MKVNDLERARNVGIVSVTCRGPETVRPPANVCTFALKEAPPAVLHAHVHSCYDPPTPTMPKVSLSSSIVRACPLTDVKTLKETFAEQIPGEIERVKRSKK